MRELCASILNVAASITPQVKMTFKRKDSDDATKCHKVCFELQRFVDTVRSNEELKTHFERIDDDKTMVLIVTLSEHDEIKAIIDEIKKKAKKLAKGEDLEME